MGFAREDWNFYNVLAKKGKRNRAKFIIRDVEELFLDLENDFVSA